MQGAHTDQLTQLIKQLLSNQCRLSRQIRAEPLQRFMPEEGSNREIEQLEISDYLQLLAHQKKHVSPARREKLRMINESGLLEQQDYKYFFAVASQAHFRRLEHPGYYKLLLDVKDTYPAGFFNPIDKDVPRTLNPQHPFLDPLKDILTAYAIRNPSLVYCQGMNYLVAYFLINEVSPEQTFWILACLVQNCLPEDYFKDLTTISIVTCIMEDILNEVVPQFQDILAEAGMDASVMLVPWLVCLFSKGFTTSVSAYLISYFMLQSQQEKAGFVLLKICACIFSCILQRQAQLPYSRDFKTLKQALELYVFGISVSEIKQTLSGVTLNYNAYLLLEDYYRTQKKETRAAMLRNRNKKMALPPCSKDYPVCFHRIEIQKKLGAIQNAMILKNGYSMQAQIIQDYLQLQPDETVDIFYTSFQQCEVGRHEHVCHLTEQEGQSKIDLRGQTFQKEMTQKIQLIDDNQQLDESIEHQLQLSTYQERFREVTEYFIVDQKYMEQEEEEDDRDCQAELQKQFEEFSKEKSVPVPAQSIRPEVHKIKEGEEQKKGIRSYLDKVFKKASSIINQLQKSREPRRSRTSIQPPPPHLEAATQETNLNPSFE